MGLGAGGYLHPSVTVESNFFFLFSFSFSFPFPSLPFFLPSFPSFFLFLFLSFFHCKDFTSAFDSEIEIPSRQSGRGHAQCLSSSSLLFLSLWK